MKLTKYQKARLLEHEWDVIETERMVKIVLGLALTPKMERFFKPVSMFLD